MLWVYLIILAQFLLAIVTLVDKHFVTSALIGKPVIYAFYIGAMSVVVILFLPFGVVMAPELAVIKLSLVAGVSHVFSILFLYKSLKLSDASDVAPALGAVSAVATFGFSTVFLGEGLTGNFLYGFILLVIGTFLTSYFHLTRKATLFLIIAGILFGFSTVFLKELFNQTAFWNGFFWSRLANVLGVTVLLLWPSNVRAIWNNVKTSSVGTKTAVVANKIIAGFAFLLILYAIKLGDVSVINALTGAQFAFLLLLAVLFTKKFPKYFYESVHHHHAILRKAIATIVIAIGLALLFL
ncbi:MAG: EamA family transporter [Candidatus Yanofskybacteria bacterium]|nr:EamA family transporter [Candidatus Yanofskybacteria bacterium]